MLHCDFNTFSIITRPGVGGAVLQTPFSLIDKVGHPFVQNLQNTFTPKPEELATWNCGTIFTNFCVLGVTCDVTHVKCHMSCVTWHHYSQNITTRDLKLWENVHHPLCVTEGVTCHMSNVNININVFFLFIFFLFFFFLKLLEPVGGVDLTLG